MRVLGFSFGIEIRKEEETMRVRESKVAICGWRQLAKEKREIEREETEREL